MIDLGKQTVHRFAGSGRESSAIRRVALASGATTTLVGKWLSRSPVSPRPRAASRSRLPLRPSRSIPARPSFGSPGASRAARPRRRASRGSSPAASTGINEDAPAALRWVADRRRGDARRRPRRRHVRCRHPPRLHPAPAQRPRHHHARREPARRPGRASCGEEGARGVRRSRRVAGLRRCAVVRRHRQP